MDRRIGGLLGVELGGGDIQSAATAIAATLKYIDFCLISCSCGLFPFLGCDVLLARFNQVHVEGLVIGVADRRVRLRRFVHDGIRS